MTHYDMIKTMLMELKAVVHEDYFEGAIEINAWVGDSLLYGWAHFSFDGEGRLIHLSGWSQGEHPWKDAPFASSTTGLQ